MTAQFWIPPNINWDLLSLDITGGLLVAAIVLTGAGVIRLAIFLAMRNDSAQRAAVWRACTRMFWMAWAVTGGLAVSIYWHTDTCLLVTMIWLFVPVLLLAVRVATR
jgi:hypothetical protein